MNSYAAHLYSQYPLAFKMPVRGPMCEKVIDRLLLNFYRHPGTALYLKMVTGYDSCVLFAGHAHLMTAACGIARSTGLQVCVTELRIAFPLAHCWLPG